jgi:hypothetical protein
MIVEARPYRAEVQLITSASVSATNLIDYGLDPAVQYSVMSSHVVRFARRDVLAVANLSNVQAPDYPFPQVPSAPRHLSIGAHASVGFQRGSDWTWHHTTEARAEFDDCAAVSFRCFVRHGWAGVTGLVFGGNPTDYWRLRLESVRIVYDLKTGAIVHTAVTASTKDAEHDGADPDAAALEAAREYAPQEMRLRVRSLEQPLPPGRIFRVDPDTGAVIEVRY